jgi:hypothetical protein
MVDNECERLVNEYLEWLRRNISVTQMGEVCEITTPFLDRHNDHLQIYVRQENGQYVLSDDGYILADLEMSGMEFDTERRRHILSTILRSFGVIREGDELQVRAQGQDLARRKHNLIQAMLAINDMFVMSRPHVLSFFREDVEQYLRMNKVRFVSMVSLIGRSSFIHNFDFAIPPSEERPERLVRAINVPSRDHISALIFAWSDTREVRSPDTEAYAMLNDEDRSVSADALHALEAYQVVPVLWSRRERYIERLAA